ncbi:MAG: hypothetical protein ABI598_05135 [Chloroflexota bacterium]
MDTSDTYDLVDCGRGRRLERFGDLLVDRPAAGADGPTLDPGSWPSAVAYRAGRGWAGPGGERPGTDDSEVSLAGITMQARLGDGGQVGLFPEHATLGPWVRAAVQARLGRPLSSRPDPASDSTAAAPEILNLFAHTGLLTLVAASAGASVVHVDASRPAVADARSNAALSELADRPIRWIVDDALAFVRREARRGRRYSGFVLDPPSYGHGGKRAGSGGWQFETGIGPLVDACLEIARPDSFWILSTHTPEWDASRLARVLEVVEGDDGRSTQAWPLELRAASGAVLRLGAAALLDPLRPRSR